MPEPVTDQPRSTEEILKTGMRRLLAAIDADKLAIHPVSVETAASCLRRLVSGPNGAVWAEAIDRYIEAP